MAAGVSAVGRRNRKRIVIANVALGTRGDLARRRHLVRVGQREAGGGVIERRVGPVRRVVAARALRSGEPSLDVIGDIAAQSLRAVPVRRVAAVAIRVGARQVVVVADVALRTISDHARGRHLVVARERPTGHGVVKRRRVGPGNRVVTA